MKNVEFISISAKPGEPSILWIGASGLYYRTRRDALDDNPSMAYPYKPFLSNTLIGALLVGSLVALVGYVFVTTRK